MDESFSVFYKESKDSVFRAIVAATKSVQAAEEVTAEAFARAFSAWSKVSKHPRPEAWVVTTALNYHRSTWRKLRRLVPIDGLEPVSIDDFPPEDPIVGRVMELPVRQREAIAICVLMDLDSETAGQILGLAPSTVRVHLHRGLSTLREQIEREDSRP